jgi:hypothetical protein
VHVFLRGDPPLQAFACAFDELGGEGFGATRGKAHLESIWQLDASRNPQVDLTRSREATESVLVHLDEPSAPTHRLRISFLTPTEIKAGDVIAPRPDFPVLFGRARDRVATLSAFYGSGPLALDFQGMGQRAESICMTKCELRRVEAERRSSRTGQRHSLGGFIGDAEFEGDLREFMPILYAAEWTGVGRQTVWGKGEIRCFPSAI